MIINLKQSSGFACFCGVNKAIRVAYIHLINKSSGAHYKFCIRTNSPGLAICLPYPQEVLLKVSVFSKAVSFNLVFARAEIHKMLSMAIYVCVILVPLTTILSRFEQFAIWTLFEI